ncbi:MAG: hypothetical protein O2798_01495 [Chloroflexi bacterium]|nr:hypothetical protein [Chloroflexota bacterium]MDA1239494.1 hypothetical protein [Chloroflexota bacterium]
MALLAPPVVEPLLRRIREVDSAPAIEAALLPREPSPEWRDRFREDYLAERPWLTDIDPLEDPLEPSDVPVPPVWAALRERWQQSPVFNRLVVPLLISLAPVLLAGMLALAWPSPASSAAVSGDPVVPAVVQTATLSLDVIDPAGPPSSVPVDRPTNSFEIGLSSVVPGDPATFVVESARFATCVAVVEHGGGAARQVLGEATGRGLIWTWFVPVGASSSGGAVMLTCDGRTTRIPFGLDAPPIGRLAPTAAAALSAGASEDHPER